MLTQLAIGVGLCVLLSLVWLALHRYGATQVDESAGPTGEPECTSRCSHCHCGRFPDDDRSPSTEKDSER
ncbi:MAG: hypothetical protein KC609_02060 [Myxococcales bacterium]|nr:hypothetical protein [Myxococcales bacterium]